MGLECEWSTYAAAILLASVKITVAWIKIVRRWCLHGLCLTYIALEMHIDLHVNLNIWWNGFVVKVEAKQTKVWRNVCELWHLHAKNISKWLHLYWKMVLKSMQRQKVNSYTLKLEWWNCKKTKIPLSNVTFKCLIPTLGPKHYIHKQCHDTETSL